MPPWVQPQPNGDCVVTLWVVPGASRTEVVGTHGDALKIKIAVPPEDGRVNRAIVRLLTELTGARATLEGGARSRRKTVRLEQTDKAQIVDLLVRTTPPPPIEDGRTANS